MLFGQDLMPSAQQAKDISLLINKYSEAREKRDTVLLKSILTPQCRSIGIHRKMEKWHQRLGERHVKEFGHQPWNQNS